MQRIDESELILNKRGAVYHINLRPEEVAETIITVGDPHRVKLVSQFFDSIEIKQEYREFISHTGRVGKKRLTVISSGIGPDNIDIVMNELDALFNIDFSTRTVKEKLTSFNIIRLGTAGSLQATIPVDSFVSSTHGLGLDNVLNYYRHEHNDEEKQLLHSFVTQTQLHSQITNPYISTASASLLKHFVQDFNGGITVTCPGFYGPQGRVLRLGLKNPELINRLTQFSFGQHRIVNFEMETSTLYGLSKLLGHNCLSVSAIIANRVQKTFSQDPHEVVVRLIKTTLEILSSI
jgi:uridine phosphorylase